LGLFEPTIFCLPCEKSFYISMIMKNVHKGINFRKRKRLL